MNNNEYKEQLLETGLLIRTSSPTQYRMKECYYCGDTRGHFYIKIDPNSDDPVLFNCFKCNNSGIINKDFLNYFELDSIIIPVINPSRRVSKRKRKLDTKPIPVEDNEQSNQAKEYIQHRIGVMPTTEELEMFQFISNPADYARTFLGGDLTQLRNRYWFRLTNGNIKGRSSDNNSFRWMGYKTGQELEKGFYTIKQPFDVRAQINVVISEGIFDAIGLFYHYEIDNPIYLCSMDSKYQSALYYLLSIGIFGKSVNIKFFIDSDAKPPYVNKHMRKLFQSIDIYRNAKDKDYGVPEENIQIEKVFR